MDSLLDNEEEIPAKTSMPNQALWFVLHALLALATWFALMLIGYAMNPAGVSQWMILALSLGIPLVVGLIATKIHPDGMASAVWLLGLIWILIVALWVLDMPTGPNRCLDCDATQKLTRTFFSWPRPSGLMDDDGPFLGTWPAAALFGYSIGAWLGRKRE